MRGSPSFAHVLWTRAQDSPERLALSFLNDPAGSVTYGELHRRAATLAARLSGVTRSGDRVVLLMPPGIDYVCAFFGCLYAGVIAVPTYPPLDERQLPGLVSVIRDAQPSAALTPGDLTDVAEQSLARHGVTSRLQWLAVDDGDDRRPIADPPATGGDDVAFLQYTSGSTGSPRGAMVTHANLLDNSEAIRTMFGHSDQSMGVVWLPPYHDMGLIGGILQPIYVGFPVALMSPLAFLANPRSWLAAVSEYRATTSGGPNFAFDLCVRKIPAEQRTGLDLSSWSVAFCGAEPVRAETLERFAAAFEPCGFSRHAFYPCYGLAEGTLIASGGRKGAGVRSLPGSNPAVSCGRAIPGGQIEVWRPEAATSVPEGDVGEICISGSSVTAGYWNAPTATSATFVTGSDGRRVLRTGDLGFLRDGELYLTGRLKDLVIVRGRNLPAEDIEYAVAGCHPAVRPGGVAAFELDLTGTTGLAVLVELADADPAVRAEVTSEVQRVLVATFGVRAERVLLARRGAVPRTPSGKTRRSECRRRYLAGQLKLLTTGTGAAGVEPATRLVGRIVEFAAEVLTVPVSSIGADDALTGAGLDSLRAVELRQLVRDNLEVDLPLRMMLAGASARDLSRAATEPQEDDTTDGAGPELSDGERGLWLASRLSGNPHHYVLAIGLELYGAVDAAVIGRTIGLLAERHPALHTYFPDVGGEPRRMPCPEPLAPRIIDADDADFDDVVAGCASEGIDPAAGPLWRVTLIRRSGAATADRSVLVLCAHHMACDVWSLDVLAREFGEGYATLARGEQPDWVPAGDPAWLAARQARRLAGEPGRELAEFWRGALRALPPSAALPQARPHRRAAAPADRHRMRIPAEIVDGVGSLVRETGVTPYTVLQTSIAWLLYRYSGEKRFVLGMPVPGRLDTESFSAVGYFVNPLPLVCEIDPAEDFRDHLRRFADRAAEAQAHQGYPYQRILEHCVPPDRRGDLIRILLLQQQAPTGHAPTLLSATSARRRLGGLEVRTRFVTQRTAPFELTVEVVTAGKEVDCTFTHDSEALSGVDVEAFARHWTRLLAEVTAEPRVRPGEVEILAADERHRLLEDWNAITSQVDGPVSVAGRVLAGCEKNAGQIAVRDQHNELTFGELDRRSALLATALAGHGSVDDRPVALMLPRSTDLVVGMVAALRTGSPYLPLDTDHPDARLAAILDDAQPAVVVTNAEIAGTRPILAGRVVLVEDDLGATGLSPPAPPAHPARLAHVIYTSGSTGTPKGVACTHRGVLNLVADFQSRVGISPGDRCGWWTSPGFDVSVHEVLSALTAGATVEACPPHARHDADALMRWAADRRLTGSYLPPHLLPDVADWLADNPGKATLQWLLVGVEPIPEPLLRRIARLLPGVTVLNGYGPTESTVWATFHLVDREGVADGITPLGRPVANCPIYLLDQHLQPVPAGVPGEIYIGGNGLARGYHGLPGLTADRFVPSPFAPSERLYRTGDLAYRRYSGELVFTGRADQQAKVLGMRVEPREVETVMVGHPAVTAAVVLREGAAPWTRLIGYARVAPEQVYDRVLADEITQHLRARLPGPMVPDHILLVGDWPMTVNGKIDRARLPRPSLSRSGYVAPVGEVETAIAEVWAQLLELPAVGRTDNFFRLGGHSLAAARISAALGERLGVPVEPAYLMEHQTIAELAAALPPRPENRADLDSRDVLAQHIAALPAEAYQLLDLDPRGGRP